MMASMARKKKGPVSIVVKQIIGLAIVPSQRTKMADSVKTTAVEEEEAVVAKAVVEGEEETTDETIEMTLALKRRIGNINNPLQASPKPKQMMVKPPLGVPSASDGLQLMGLVPILEREVTM